MLLESKFSVFETVPDLYLILSPELIIYNASNAYLEATLKVRENIIGRPIFEVFPDNPDLINPDGVSNLRFSLEQVLKYKKAHQMEVQRYDVQRPMHLGSGYEEKFWYPTNTPVLNSHNEVDYIVHKVLDVTKQVLSDKQYKSLATASALEIEKAVSSKNETELERQKLYALFMQAPAIVAVMRGPDHIFELANPRYMQLVGIDRQIIGKTVREALPEIEGQGFFELLDQVYKSKEPFIGNELPAKLIKNTGGEFEEVFLNLVYQPALDVEGNVYGILVHAVDVTEQVISRKLLKENEAKFRIILNNAPLAIGLYVGKNMVIENPNQTFIDILGKGPGIEGLPLRVAMPELITEGQPFLNILDDVYENGIGFSTEGTLIKIFRNGEMTNNFYDFSYTPVFDADGKTYTIVVIAKDVTPPGASVVCQNGRSSLVPGIN